MVQISIISLGYLVPAGIVALIASPLGLDYSCAASMYGLPYHKLTDSNQLSAVLEQALEEEGLSLVEVITQS